MIGTTLAARSAGLTVVGATLWTSAARKLASVEALGLPTMTLADSR